MALHCSTGASSKKTIRLIEIFGSVQGETSLTGLTTTFIRLAACNLRCTWCDTTYSFGRGTEYSFQQILDQVKENSCRHVCVTGGEPLLQDSVHSLMIQLCDLGYVVSLETSGSLSTEKVDPRVVTILDIKCPGSGMSDKNYWKNLEWLRPHDEIKFVLLDREDYCYAKEISEKYHLFDRSVPVLLSPVYGKMDPKDLVTWMLEDQLPARLNMQIHKVIWSPETRGV